MNVSRRSFLRGALTVGALSVLPAIPAFAERIPTLWGDGIHDDTQALQAFLDGKPVRVDGAFIAVRSGDGVRLSGGRFLVSDTIFVGDGRPSCVMTECLFWKSAAMNRDAPVMSLSRWNGHIANNVIEGRLHLSVGDLSRLDA